MKSEIAAYVLLALMFIMLGFSFGYNAGMKKASEIQDRVHCEVSYGNKPLQEVPVECLKWFDIKEK